MRETILSAMTRPSLVTTRFSEWLTTFDRNWHFLSSSRIESKYFPSYQVERVRNDLVSATRPALVQPNVWPTFWQTFGRSGTDPWPKHHATTTASARRACGPKLQYLHTLSISGHPHWPADIHPRLLRLAASTEIRRHGDAVRDWSSRSSQRLQVVPRPPF